MGDGLNKMARCRTLKEALESEIMREPVEQWVVRGEVDADRDNCGDADYVDSEDAGRK